MDFDLLGGSWAYRLLGRILSYIVTLAKESAIGRSAAWILRKYQAWAKGSFIICAISRMADAFGGSIRNSAMVTRLLKEDETGRYRERGLVFSLYQWKLALLRRAYRAARLDRVFEHSVFRQSWLFAIVVMALTPILPTMVILALVLLAVGSVALGLLHTPSEQLVYSAVNKYTWFYMLAYGLATLASVTFWGSLNAGLITLAFILFYHVLLFSIQTKKQLYRLLLVLAGAGALVSAYGILQFINPDLFADNAWLDEDMFEFGARVYSTLHNPNVLGTYLLLVIPPVLAGFVIAPTHQGRLYFLLCAVALALCLVLTYSRGAYLGILIALAVFFVLLDRRFIIPGILAVILLFMFLPDAILHRFFSIGDLADRSTSYRMFIWLGTLAMLRDYWFSGIGPGEAAWGMVYPAYAFAGITTPHSHNLFLQIISDAGAPGILVFLALLYQYFKQAFAALRRRVTGPQRVLVIAGIASIIGFLVQGMTDYTFYNFRVMLFFWGILAFGVLAVRYDKLRD